MWKQHSFASGFTLIELLVVVLIIGILASIALPQYRKAVNKSRMVQLTIGMDSVRKGVEIYRLANGYLGGWQDALEENGDWWSNDSYFQLGTREGSGEGATPNSVWYCLQPKNGDKAYFYHVMFADGTEKRVCAGDDCKKYVNGCAINYNSCHGGSSQAESTSCLMEL